MPSWRTSSDSVGTYLQIRRALYVATLMRQRCMPLEIVVYYFYWCLAEYGSCFWAQFLLQTAIGRLVGERNLSDGLALGRYSKMTIFRVTTALTLWYNHNKQLFEHQSNTSFDLVRQV